MKLIFAVCFAIAGIITSEAYNQYQPYRPRRSYPHQAMMFSGFYGRPFVPQGSMAAFASKDTIATNSFAGEDQYYLGAPADETLEEEKDVQQKPDAIPTLTEEHTASAEQEEEEEEDESYVPVAATTQKPKRLPKRKQKPVKKQEDDEEEDDDGQESWPFQTAGRRGLPAYNSFFPIVFGGRGANTRSANTDGGGYPGTATAIANSFSTGKGGVASSHAVAYGDPYLSMLLRNSESKKRNLQKKHD